MQLKAAKKAAEEQEDSDFINSLNDHEVELSRLERAHQAAIKANNSRLK